mgnify:CR=1 FL=1
MIQTDAQPMAFPAFLGKTPADDWCLFYQQADLARQQGDWAEVLSIYEKTARLGLRPGNPLEWHPFLEALIRAKRTEDAAALTAAFQSENERNALCAWVEKLEGLSADIRQEVLVTAGCRAP